jgi:anti-anti-sigma factor
MDSSGVNALVRARERAERLGGSIHVVTTSRPVIRVLQVTQLDRLLAVVPSVDDALACLAHPATMHSCDRPAER